MVNPTYYGTAVIISPTVVGLLLDRDLFFYRLEEVLVCWLFFGLAFLSLALVILTGTLIFSAGEWLIYRASAAARVMSKASPPERATFHFKALK